MISPLNEFFLSLASLAIIRAQEERRNPFYFSNNEASRSLIFGVELVLRRKNYDGKIACFPEGPYVHFTQFANVCFQRRDLID